MVCFDMEVEPSVFQPRMRLVVLSQVPQALLQNQALEDFVQIPAEDQQVAHLASSAASSVPKANPSCSCPFTEAAIKPGQELQCPRNSSNYQILYHVPSD